MQASTLRLFFALWPEELALEKTSALSRDVARASGGRPVPPQNLHVTLAFLGSQPASTIARIENAAAAIDSDRFELVLDRLGFWRKAGIAWLGSGSAPPPPLIALHRALVAALSALNIDLDDRLYHPHVTLARHATSAVLSTVSPPIVWRADAFSLVASEVGRNGSVYRRLAQWPLCSAP